VRVIGRYRIGEPLADGAHATVRHAHDPVDAGRALVAKIAKPGHEHTLRTEWQLCAGMRHDRVLTPVALVDNGDDVALVLPRAAHSSQRCVGLLSDGEVAAVLDDVLCALTAAHDADVAHRDVRPCNVLLDHEGRALLADFGSAAPLTPQSRDADVRAAAQLGDALLADEYVDTAFGTWLLDTIDAADAGQPPSLATLRDRIRSLGVERRAPAPRDAPRFVVEPPTLVVDVRRRSG
jgi:serine/threonine protein kinase